MEPNHDLQPSLDSGEEMKKNQRTKELNMQNSGELQARMSKELQDIQNSGESKDPGESEEIHTIQNSGELDEQQKTGVNLGEHPVSQQQGF